MPTCTLNGSQRVTVSSSQLYRVSAHIFEFPALSVTVCIQSHMLLHDAAVFCIVASHLTIYHISQVIGRKTTNMTLTLSIIWVIIVFKCD